MNNIIQRNFENSYQDTFNNRVVPDFNTPINPIKTVTRKLTLHFDSAFRDVRGAVDIATDFTYTLLEPVNEVLSLRLSSINIPNSWYIISSCLNNNFFYIDITDNLNETNTHKITVYDGNYTRCQLVDYLNKTYFFDSSGSSLSSPELKYIRIGYDVSNMKTIIEFNRDNPPPLGYSFSLRFLEESELNLMGSFGWTLGFRRQIYNDITDGIISEAFIDIGENRYIYVSLDDYQQNKSNIQVGYFYNSTLSSSIISKVYLTDNKYKIDYTTNGSDVNTRRYFGPVKFKKFRFSLLDKFGNVIDLNNMDFSFSLELEILYNGNNKL